MVAPLPPGEHTISFFGAMDWGEEGCYGMGMALTTDLVLIVE